MKQYLFRAFGRRIEGAKIERKKNEQI